MAFVAGTACSVFYMFGIGGLGDEMSILWS